MIAAEVQFYEVAVFFHIAAVVLVASGPICLWRVAIACTSSVRKPFL